MTEHEVWLDREDVKGCPSKHEYGTVCAECNWCGICGGAHVSHVARWVNGGWLDEHPSECAYRDDHQKLSWCVHCGYCALAESHGNPFRYCACGWTEPVEAKARLFNLVREQDITGISGTGIVAEGVRFSDGTTVLRWLKAGTARPDKVSPTTVVHESVESVEALHGHNGATKVVWR